MSGNRADEGGVVWGDAASGALALGPGGEGEGREVEVAGNTARMNGGAFRVNTLEQVGGAGVGWK